MEMSWVAKSITVNCNAFFPASFSLTYREIMYCLCAIYLCSWTILALVKLLKMLELQRKIARLVGWLLVITAGRSQCGLQKGTFLRAVDMAGVSECILLP